MERLYTQLEKTLAKKFSGEPVSLAAQAFYEKTQNAAKHMFGYPANNVPLSPLTQYLLLLHYCAPFSNNCGDVDERGNYAMDTKDTEKAILRLFAEKFGLGDEFWGYITSGGSESNSCGISLAFNKYPNGILYYSQAAHYSVEKYARLYEHVEIPTLGNDVLDVPVLLNEIEKHWNADKRPANLVLTHGTTKYGACDDIDGIVKYLREKKIPHYIHVDAALFGGIPNDQAGAPILTNAKARGINSICVSLHKYLGFPDVHSVFVATKKPDCQSIAYIGQHDTTVSGSRSIPAFALYNHVRERLNDRPQYEYIENIRYFEELLCTANIPFYRAPDSNIFVIDAPSEQTTKYFQLSCFKEADKEKAHAIIFPCHEKAELFALAEAIRTDKR